MSESVLAVPTIQRPPTVARLRMLPTAVLIAGVLVLLFALQYRSFRVADWTQFSVYDAGTTLKGDWLLAKGYVPTKDFGYTHGLVSLIFGRMGFGVLGRTPWAYLMLTMAAEVVMAFAMARINPRKLWSRAFGKSGTTCGQRFGIRMHGT